MGQKQPVVTLWLGDWWPVLEDGPPFEYIPENQKPKAGLLEKIWPFFWYQKKNEKKLAWMIQKITIFEK